MKQFVMKGYIFGPVIIFIVVWMMFLSFNKQAVNQLYEREKPIEDVIRKYAIYCYAQEGGYPESLEYLQDNYGLIINEDDYDYYYELFASNIMPDIIVTVKESER